MRASRILLKLIDEAILPAVLVIAGKISGIFLIIQILKIPWTIKTETGLPTLSLTTQNDLLAVNSYSNLLLLLLLGAGLGFFLFRAHLLHDTHIKPALTVKLLNWNLTSLLVNTFDVITAPTVWLSYLWLTVILLIITALQGANYWWVAIAGLILASVLTLSFVLDLEKEVQRIQK